MRVSDSALPANAAAEVDAASALAQERRYLRYWQGKLLPLMVRMLLGVAVFFFLASLAQLAYLHWRIERTSSVDLREPTQLLTTVASGSDAERRENAAMLMRGLLEADAIQRRHHQGRVLLMARVWTVYLGFVTGMSLALIGAAFSLGRLQGSSATVKVDAAPIKAEIVATAPGVILSALGVVLMIATILVNHTITVEDANIYLRPVEVIQSKAMEGPRFPSLPGRTDETGTPKE